MFNTCLTIKRLLATSLLLAAGLAQAQYVWVDAKGVKHFSDRSPPSSVPDKDILKAPGKGIRSLVPIGEASAVPAEAPKAPPTLADRNADYKKRMDERAEAAKKDAQAAKIKAANAQNCAAARDYKAQLASGVRIGTVGKNGEQGFMSDAERAESSARADKVLADCRRI